MTSKRGAKVCDAREAGNREKGLGMVPKKSNSCVLLE